MLLKFRKTKNNIVALLLTSMSLFHLYTGGIMMLPANWQRGIHLSFLLSLVFLLKPTFPEESKVSTKLRILSGILDPLLVVLGAFLPIFVAHTLDLANLNLGYINPNAYFLGGILILVLLEATRRVAGKELVIVLLIFMGYSYLGNLIPGFLSHRPIPTKLLIDNLVFSTRGIFGLVLGISATYIFLFVLFGSVMQYTKLTEFIWKIAQRASRKTPGGAAQVAVLSSGMMGMISGSAVANVATTGVFTIPLMKKTGFKDYYAAGVEAAASTGGQIMPPIMGATAFVISEYLGIPYIKIICAAALPAIFYFSSISFMIFNESLKLGLGTLEEFDDTKSEPYSKIIKDGWHLLVPIVLMLGMLIKGFSPVYCAIWGILAALIVSNLRKHTRMKWYEFFEMLQKGARNALSVGVCCAAVGIIIGITSQTSLGIVFSSYMVDIAHQNLLLLLVLAMITSIILGLGLPTVAVYIVGATIIVPAFVDMIQFPLSAHLFIFYYGVIGAVTPPVALASLTASGIARSDFSKTGWTGMRLAVVGFIVPFFFIYYPSIMIIYADSFWSIFYTVAIMSLSIIALTGAFEGYLFYPVCRFLRIILLFCSFSLLIRNILIQLVIGCVIIGIVIYLHFGAKYKKV